MKQSSNIYSKIYLIIIFFITKTINIYTSEHETKCQSEEIVTESQLTAKLNEFFTKRGYKFYDLYPIFLGYLKKINSEILEPNVSGFCHLKDNNLVISCCPSPDRFSYSYVYDYVANKRIGVLKSDNYLRLDIAS